MRVSTSLLLATAAALATAVTTVHAAVASQITLTSNQVWPNPQPAPGAPLPVYDNGNRNGLLLIRGVANNVVVGPAIVNPGGFRVLESNDNANVNGLTIRGIQAFNLTREALRFKSGGEFNNVRILNCNFQHSEVLAVEPDLPGGIHFENGTNYHVENVTSSFNRMVPSSYTNGDGFTAEGSVRGITFRRTVSNDNSDGGYDLKSTGTRLEDTQASRCGRSYRLWGQGTASTMYSFDARNWHVGLYSQADYVIDKLVVSSSTTAVIFRSELKSAGIGRLVVGECVFNVPAGTKLWSVDSDEFKPAVVSLGPGCSLP